MEQDIYDSVELETEVAAAARRSDDDQVRSSRARASTFTAVKKATSRSAWAAPMTCPSAAAAEASP